MLVVRGCPGGSTPASGATFWTPFAQRSTCARSLACYTGGGGEWYGFYVRRILFINRSLNTIKVHIINE